MVTAPKCKVCGSNHFGAAHVWPKLLTRPNDDVIAVTTPVYEAIQAQIDTTARTKPTFDRTAYQREYMRKRRTESKTGKGK